MIGADELEEAITDALLVFVIAFDLDVGTRIEVLEEGPVVSELSPITARDESFELFFSLAGNAHGMLVGDIHDISGENDFLAFFEMRLVMRLDVFLSTRRFAFHFLGRDDFASCRKGLTGR